MGHAFGSLGGALVLFGGFPVGGGWAGSSVRVGGGKLTPLVLGLLILVGAAAMVGYTGMLGNVYNASQAYMGLSILLR